MSMADEKKVNKSEAIRNYLKTNPEAGPKEVKEALGKQGIEVSDGLVSNIKHKLANPDGSKSSKGRQTRSTELTASELLQAVEVVNGAGGADSVRSVLDTCESLVKELGGFDRVRQALDLIDKFGGKSTPVAAAAEPAAAEQKPANGSGKSGKKEGAAA